MMSTPSKDGPSSVACLSCREKHLKCDGQMPTCGRCTESGASCTFVRSRRGYQGRKRKGVFTGLSNEPTPTSSEATGSSALNADLAASSAEFGPSEDQQIHMEETISIPRTPGLQFEHDRLVGIYYRDIHPAHPIILPQKMYLQDRNVLPDFLKAVMAFMASHLSSGDFRGLQEEAERVFQPGIPEDGFKVQALILLTLTSYARFERDRGNRALTEAIALASRIGPNIKPFNCGQGPIYEESWRRTYWELYTITGLISLIADENFRIRSPDSLLLPGHCEDYKNGRCSELRGIRSMRDRIPLEDGFEWSSFAYKVEAMRILRSIFESESGGTRMADAQVQAFGASITGFLLSLPESKRTPITDDGETDEVMSCALMIINLAGVGLHFPRSSLAGKASFKTVCGNDGREKVESIDERFHRAAVIRYANGLSRLISARHSLRTLTPCFSCSIAFAAAVHLAAILPRDSSEAQHKEHIQLELSALNIVSSIWPIGGVVKAQLAQYAREVLSARPTVSTTNALPDSILPAPVPLSAELWLEDLTSHYLDVPTDGFLLNLMSPPGDSSNPTT